MGRAGPPLNPGILFHSEEATGIGHTVGPLGWALEESEVALQAGFTMNGGGPSGMTGLPGSWEECLEGSRAVVTLREA